MKKTRVACVLLMYSVASTAVGLSAGAPPVGEDKVTIGFITDFSGLYADNDGPGGLEAIRMAISDFGGKVAESQSSCSMPITKIRLTSPQRVRVSGQTRGA